MPESRLFQRFLFVFCSAARILASLPKPQFLYELRNSAMLPGRLPPPLHIAAAEFTHRIATDQCHRTLDFALE